jgi:hypothetical protein
MYNCKYIYSLLILYTEFHVSRTYAKFRLNCRTTHKAEQACYTALTVWFLCLGVFTVQQGMDCFNIQVSLTFSFNGSIYISKKT